VKALVFHAEGLHDDENWEAVLHVLDVLARRGGRATFLVFPFPAKVHGLDISDRVRTLVDAGHEVGQHTHFYEGTRIAKPDKVDDYSAANVRACVERDQEDLRGMGVDPKGFCAGAWAVHETLWDVLAERGFDYDCSTRVPGPRSPLGGPLARWRRTPEVHRSGGRELVCLPTTSSLAAWARPGRTPGWEPDEGNRVVYLHDWDLRSRAVRAALALFLRIEGRRLATTARLADEIRASPGALAGGPS
jgi:peptidoglycan/xylan/chitin deacetylase (PgdA/CDA1 family)